MKIKSLHIQKYKRFNNLEIKFGENISIIKGNNENGKSSILEALTHLLFTNPQTRKKQIVERIKQWNSDAMPVLSLVFEYKKKEYSLEQDFEKQKISLSKEGDLLTDDFGKVSQKLVEMTHIPSETIFNSTACVHQYEMVLPKTPDELKEVLQRVVISGGNSNLSLRKLFKSLDQKITSLTKGLDRPSGEPGLIKSTKDSLAEKEQQLGVMKQQVTKVLEARTNISHLEKEKNRLNKEIELLKGHMKAYELLTDTQEKISAINTQLQTFEQRRYELEKIDQRLNELNDSIGDKSITREKLEGVSDKVHAYETELDVLNRHVKLSPAEVQQDQPLSLIQRLFSQKKSKYMTFLALGVFFSAATTIFLQVWLGILLFLLSFWIFFLQLLNLKKTRNIQKTEVLRTQNKLLQARTKLSEKLDSLLATYEYPTSKEFYKHKDQLVAIWKETDLLKAKREGLLGGKKLKQFVAEHMSLLAEGRKLETVLTHDVKASAMTSDEYFKKKKDLDTLEKKKSTVESEYFEYSGIISSIELSEENVSVLNEEIALLQEQYDRYINQKEIYVITRDTIFESVQKISQNTAQPIATYIERYLPLITNKRYSKIRISPDFDIDLFSEEKKDWINPVGILSTGAIEQVYFLFRLAFLDLITKGTGTPLFLDDAFISFDAMRREGVLALLGEIAKKRQVILFTCHEEFDSWGKKIEISS